MNERDERSTPGSGRMTDASELNALFIRRVRIIIRLLQLIHIQFGFQFFFLAYFSS